ncbi:MAG TPA: M23 family metallopeptidase, partial [Herpetosiphonaceae bacterium]
RPADAAQGRAWSFSLPDQRFSEVSGLLGAWPLSFARAADGSWLALGGVAVLDEPGPVELRVSALRADGSVFYGAAQALIVDGGYRSERIVLPPEVNDAIARNQDKVLAERAAVNAIWPRVSAEKLWRGPFALPAEGRVSSEFGTRRAYNDGPFSSYHEGLDIANAAGTPVRAANRGRVALAEEGLVVRGGAVIIDHGLGLHTGYWHMQRVLVRPGQLVEQGEVIGLMGAEGMVTGAHVHWDVRIGSLNLRPQDWIERDHGAGLRQ